MSNKIVAPGEIAINAWKLCMVYFNENGEPEASREPTKEEIAAPSVPAAGWKLVPVELTDAMRAIVNNDECVYETADALYRDLLAATPAPTTDTTPGEALRLLQHAHSALQYHTDQTRPIANTHAVMRELADYLARCAPATPQPSALGTQQD